MCFINEVHTGGSATNAIELNVVNAGVAARAMRIDADLDAHFYDDVDAVGKIKTSSRLELEDPGAGTGVVSMEALAGTVDYYLRWPATLPTANQVLSVDSVVGNVVSLEYVTGSGGSVDSHVCYNTGAGFGSGDTAIRRVDNLESSSGTDITGAASGTNGTSFTINTAGVYTADYCDYHGSATSTWGISVNADSSGRDTAIGSLTEAQGKLFRVQVNGATLNCASRTRRYAVNDVIRPHGDTTQDGTGTFVRMCVTRVN